MNVGVFPPPPPPVPHSPLATTIISSTVGMSSRYSAERDTIKPAPPLPGTPVIDGFDTALSATDPTAPVLLTPSRKVPSGLRGVSSVLESLTVVFFFNFSTFA